jgi:hypothetical protein
MTQVVKRLLCKHEALSSSPRPTRRNKIWVNSVLGETVKAMSIGFETEVPEIPLLKGISIFTFHES